MCQNRSHLEHQAHFSCLLFRNSAVDVAIESYSFIATLIASSRSSLKALKLGMSIRMGSIVPLWIRSFKSSDVPSSRSNRCPKAPQIYRSHDSSPPGQRRVTSTRILSWGPWQPLSSDQLFRSRKLWSFVYRLSPSIQGLELAGLVTLKSSAMVLVLMALLGTSPLHMILQGLRDLGLSSKLVMLLHFCSRYVHVIKDENRRIHEAATLRGYRPGLSVMGLKTAAFMVGSLLVKSYDRSLRVNDALSLRGFDGTFPTVHEPIPLRGLDLAHFGGLVAMFGGCLIT